VEGDGRHTSRDVVIQISDGGSTITDQHGHYTSSGHLAGTHTLTPFKEGCMFSPPSLTILLTDGDLGGNDFDADCDDDDGAPATWLAPVWQALLELFNAA
jgi:hypothetical protein